MREQEQNNDQIKRRSVYDQSDKMKTIEGQHMYIHISQTLNFILVVISINIT